MSRDYIRRLEAGPEGEELKNLWTTFDHNEACPDVFEDRDLNTREKIERAQLNESFIRPVHGSSD